MAEKLDIQELDQVVVRFSGDSGDGMQFAGNIFSTVSATVGNGISTFPVSNVKRLLMVALLTMLAVLQTMAQKQKDFDAAMQNGKGANRLYAVSSDFQKRNLTKLSEKAAKWGYKLLNADENHVYFLPLGEVDAWNAAQDAMDKFRQYPSRIQNIRETHPNEYFNERFLQGPALIQKSDYANPKLSGYDFTATGSAWVFDGEKDGLVLMNNLRWTGKVTNGMLDGKGDGFLVTTAKNGDNTYYSFSGTFRNGFPHGDIAYSVLFPVFEPFKPAFSKCVRKRMTVGDMHDGMAAFREYGWLYRERGNDEKKYTTGYGFISPDGRIVVSPSYSEVKQEFSNGRAVVTTKGIDVTIDKEGRHLEIVSAPTSIPQNFCSGESGFKHTKVIKIPASVKEIESRAFFNNDSVTEIILPEGLKVIANEAFMSCNNLRKINIPSTVTRIGKGAFNYCSELTTISIPQSVEEIGRNAFKACYALTNVRFPAKLINSIQGIRIFESCESLHAVDVVGESGKVTKDANWYWWDEESHETTAARKQAWDHAEENSENFEWPINHDGKTESESSVWKPDYDLTEFLSSGWRVYEKLVDFRNKKNVPVCMMVHGDSHERKYAFCYWVDNVEGGGAHMVRSPSYTNYRDCIAAAYFFHVKKKLRTKGLVKYSGWSPAMEKKYGYR